MRNVPSVGILRSQQYESIASNMNVLATPDYRKSSMTSNSSVLNMNLNENNASSSIAANNYDAINILNIFVREFANIPKPDDETLNSLFYDFVQTKKEMLKAKQIRRLTFSVASKRQLPSYFTFRARDDFMEDKIYRHLEPALAFQLEIYRLHSFYLELIPTGNLKMHIYLGKAKVPKGRAIKILGIFLLFLNIWLITVIPWSTVYTMSFYIHRILDFGIEFFKRL